MRDFLRITCVLLIFAAVARCDTTGEEVVAPTLEPELAADLPSRPEVTEEQYDSIESIFEVRGNTYVMMLPDESYVQGDTRAYLFDIPVPVWLEHTVFAKVGIDQQIPFNRTDDFSEIVGFPSLGLLGSVEIPEAPCDGSHELIWIEGVTHHKGSVPITVRINGVPVPFNPGDTDTSNDYQTCGSGGGSGSPNGPPQGEELDCEQVFVTLEVWNEDEQRWEEIWSGWATVCE